MERSWGKGEKGSFPFFLNHEDDAHNQLNIEVDDNNIAKSNDDKEIESSRLPNIGNGNSLPIIVLVMAEMLIRMITRERNTHR